MNSMERTVTVIPPSIDLMNQSASIPLHKLRVAAYARVSTDSEEQLTSYEAQQNYYTDKIMTNREWTMAGIFADAPVIIGLKTLRREKCWKRGAF